MIAVESSLEDSDAHGWGSSDINTVTAAPWIELAMQLNEYMTQSIQGEVNVFQCYRIKNNPQLLLREEYAEIKNYLNTCANKLQEKVDLMLNPGGSAFEIRANLDYLRENSFNLCEIQKYTRKNY